MNKYVNNLTLPNGTNVLIKDLEGRTNLSNEIRRATAKETELEESDTHLRNDLTTETNARKQSETALQQKINAEVSAREQGDNKNNAEIAKINSNITGIENKNTEQDNDISTLRTMISSPYNFKGDVANISALPSSGNVNDTYYVQDVKYKVTWTGSAWSQSSLSEADYQTELSELRGNVTTHYDYYDVLTNASNNIIDLVNERELVKGVIDTSITPVYPGILSHRCCVIDIDSVENKTVPFLINYEFDGIVPLFKRTFFASNGTTKLDGDSDWRTFDKANPILSSVDDAKIGYPSMKYLAIDIVFTTDGTLSTFISEGIQDTFVFRIYQATQKTETFVVVDKNGNGDYTTIQSAINNTGNGTTILVNNGTYEEEVRMFNEERRIIGQSKENTFIISRNPEYGHEPLQADIGYIANFTIIGGYNQNYVAGSTDATCYALHIENGNQKDRTLLIENCNLISNVSSAVGMGVRYNQKVIFRNCYFETKAPKVYSKVYSQFTDCGAIFCHNDASGSNLGTGAYVSVESCELKGVNTALALQSQNNGNTMYVRFLKNTLWSTVNRKNNAVTIRINPPTEGHIAGSDVVLDDISFGNNIALLNA